MTRNQNQQKLSTYSISPSDFEQWIESNGGANNVITALINTDVKEHRKRSSQLTINVPRKPEAAAVVPTSTSIPPLSPPPSPLLKDTPFFMPAPTTTLIPAPAYHQPLPSNPDNITSMAAPLTPTTSIPVPSTCSLNTSGSARSHKKSKSWLSGLFSSSTFSSSCNTTTTASHSHDTHRHKKSHSAPSFFFFGTKKRKHASSFSTTPPIPIPKGPSTKQSTPPPEPPKHRPELNLPERYPSSIERVLYQISCMKLMNRRPLQQQVVVANLIYKYTTLMAEERESYFQRRRIQRQQQQEQRLQEQCLQKSYRKENEEEREEQGEERKTNNEYPNTNTNTTKLNFLESCVIEGSRLELDGLYDYNDDEDDEEEEDSHEEQRVVLFIKNL